MQIFRSGLIIHLSESPRFQTGTIVFVETIGIENFQKEFESKQSNFPIPIIETTKWATKQIEIEDPFGNLFRFNQNILENKS